MCGFFVWVIFRNLITKRGDVYGESTPDHGKRAPHPGSGMTAESPFSHMYIETQKKNDPDF